MRTEDPGDSSSLPRKRLDALGYAVLNALGVLLVLPRATTAGLGDDKDHENHKKHPAHGNKCSAIPHSLPCAMT